MAQFLKAAVISTFVGVVMILLIGFWWFYRPLPQVEPPQLVVSDEFSMPDDPKLKSDWDALYNEALERFKEIPMRSASFPDHESYRLLLMPTFHSPILIRASRTANGLELTTKLLDGKGGYEIGKLVSNEKRPMTEAEWQHLTELLNRASFWSMPTIDRADDPMPDGASWFIQSRRDDIFHDVIRITPNARLLEACKYFLQLAGREMDYEGYWPIYD